MIIVVIVIATLVMMVRVVAKVSMKIIKEKVKAPI